jgi:hypothetical protein
MKKWKLIALSLVVAVIIAGCGKVPDAQLQQADAALKAAQTAGAPQYVPEAWGRAQKAADRMKAEVDAQGKRFSLFRSYGKAKTMAAEVVRLAEQALADANAKKTQLRGEVTAMIEDIGASLASARSQLSKLPRTRGLDVPALRVTLNSADRQLEQARADLSAGAYDRAMAVAAQARDAVTGVFKAIEKATGLRPSRKR